MKNVKCRSVTKSTMPVLVPQFLIALFLIFNCQAELTVTVHPGYQLAPEESPTTDTLNQLGQPTAEISGTIDGSVGLTAGSVTGTHLANSVPDGRTIDFTNSVPRSLEIKQYGLGVNEISTNLFTTNSGLLGGGGLRISVLWDTNTITAVLNTNDGRLHLTLNTNLAGFGLLYNNTNFLFSVKTFSVTNAVPTATGASTNAHGLALIPQIVRGVLVCTNAELGYNVGDEIELSQVQAASSGACPIVVSADSTNVFASYIGTTPATGWNIRRRGASAGAGATITAINWNLKYYARP